jgi:hypothetical protein
LKRELITDDSHLLYRFVSCFPPPDTFDRPHPKRAVRFNTPRTALSDFYAQLPAPLPPLYERLILSYRWPVTYLDSLTFVAHPHGDGLSGLLGNMQYDSGIWQECTANGLIPFAKGFDVSFDPVCFDINRRTREGDCRIVRLDHEEIMCFERLVEIETIAPSFRDFVWRIVGLP